MKRKMTRCGVAALIVVAFGFLAYGFWPADRMGTRDLMCSKVLHERGQAICQRLERELEWTWMGHAIISPGWRIGFDGVRRTYCAEKLGPHDVAALEAIRRQSIDWRAQDGAEMLLRLVRAQDGTGSEAETSIFNRSNPSYLLKDGCA
jgi:hypothetical protein